LTLLLYDVVVVGGDVMNPVRRCLYGRRRGRRSEEEEFHQIVQLEGESGFPSLPREVDSHFIERGHHSKAAVVAHR